MLFFKSNFFHCYVNNGEKYTKEKQFNGIVLIQQKEIQPAKITLKTIKAMHLQHLILLLSIIIYDLSKKTTTIKSSSKKKKKKQAKFSIQSRQKRRL